MDTRTGSIRGARQAAADTDFWRGLARAVAGALLFGLPVFMTMEMWWLGFAIRPVRLALFLALSLPLLACLSYLAGFRHDAGWLDALVDGLVAWLVGAVTAALALALFGALSPGMSLPEIAGKVILLSVPAGIGAALASSQLGTDRDDQDDDRHQSYGGELFLMLAGAVYFAFNIAPTDEVPLIAIRQTSPWVAMVLVLASLLVLHGFVYGVGFRGGHGVRPGRKAIGELLGLTLPGYVIALLASAYVLWTFGRLEGLHFAAMLHVVLVLALPASVGAAAARLIL
ncbi:MAG: TIGR02587 family membrane protein [Geminicoccaceae bacterium]